MMAVEDEKVICSQQTISSVRVGFARNVNELRTFTDPALVVDGTVDNNNRWSYNVDKTMHVAVIRI